MDGDERTYPATGRSLFHPQNIIELDEAILCRILTSLYFTNIIKLRLWTVCKQFRSAISNSASIHEIGLDDDIDDRAWKNKNQRSHRDLLARMFREILER